MNFNYRNNSILQRVENRYFCFLEDRFYWEWINLFWVFYWKSKQTTQ